MLTVCGKHLKNSLRKGFHMYPMNAQDKEIFQTILYSLIAILAFGKFFADWILDKINENYIKGFIIEITRIRRDLYSQEANGGSIPAGDKRDLERLREKIEDLLWQKKSESPFEVRRQINGYCKKLDGIKEKISEAKKDSEGRTI